MSTKVVIIGAGIAGLAAASHFCEENFDEFIILEANSVIGGRIKTLPFQQSFIELGAQWIHGTENNPVYDLAMSLNAIDESKGEADQVFYSSQDGERLEENVVESIQKEAQSLLDNLDEKIDENDSNQSIGALLDEGYSAIASNYESEMESELIKGVFRAAFNGERFENSCQDLHDLSANGWNNFETLEGNLFTNTKSGYSKIVEHLASKLKSNQLKLNQQVEKIDWSGEQIIISTYDSVQNKRVQWFCKAVLCTSSLGYLKKNHSLLFSPNLPSDKIHSINSLGFGCLNKIFIIFDDDFDEDFQGLEIIWRDDKDLELEKCKKKWKLENLDFCRALDNFEKLPNHKNILLTFTVGNYSEIIENLEDNCILDIVTELIEKCFFYADLPRPVKIVRSKWSSDSFVKGSYSYLKVGSSIDDMDTLAASVQDRLFFAGEATIYKHVGTVHGAYLSGYDQATKILSCLNFE